MKKILFIILSFVTSISNAKVVHFVVDMSQQTVNATGVHIVGDFQTIAGYSGGDWNSATTSMTQMVGDTNMYEVYVNVPAFAKYEYKFVNGDQFYEAEFVPIESRVGYNFNDNRWIYVDSIANDTSFVGNLLFAGNAPSGKMLVRYLVDLSSQTSVSANGVHVITNYQNFNPVDDILYSFGSNVYEVINYVDSGSYQYKYVNGNSTSDMESVPSSCSDISGNRNVVVASDIVLPVDCFNACGACATSGVSEIQHASFNLFPNPVKDNLSVRFVNKEERQIKIYNVSGQELYRDLFVGDYELLNTESFPEGQYIISVINKSGQQETSSFIKL